MKARTSKRIRERREASDAVPLICRVFFIGVAIIEELQSALKQLIDLFLADLMRREQFMEIKVWESTIGHTRGQKFAQLAGIDRAQQTDFLEHRTPQGILEDGGIEQSANLGAGSGLDQHGTEQPQRVFLQVKSAVLCVGIHTNAG